jgi:hypothetical protein
MFSKIKQIICFSLCLPVILIAACAPIAVTTSSVSSATTTATIFNLPISAAFPDSPAQLKIDSDLPGMIRVIGSSGAEFVIGTVQLSNQDWMPVIGYSNHETAIAQTTKTRVTINDASANLWKLRVSDSQPFSLIIRNMAAEGHWNFSGLPITSLAAEMGKARNAYTFDEVNPGTMQNCHFVCGDGEVIAEGILNAVCKEMVIEAGKGPLTLRFGGKELLQEMKVNITSGSGAVSISISPDIPARITVSGKNQISIGEGWLLQSSSGSSRVYQTPVFKNTIGKAIDISISNSASPVFLNPPPG